MKEITNRTAIYAYPKSPFKEWAKLYNESPIEDLEQRLNEKHVYLIDWSYNEDINEALEPYYIKIFEYELLSWNVIKKEWPQKRNYEIFLEWFAVTLCDDIFDLETEKMILEKL